MIAEFVQHVVNGLILGGGYALMGIGLTLIFGIMRVVNFAHGEFYMLGAFFLFTLFTLGGINFFVGRAPGRARRRRWSGAVVERLILRRLRDQPIEIPMLATVALSVIIQNARHPALGPVAEDDPAAVLAGAAHPRPRARGGHPGLRRA